MWLILELSTPQASIALLDEQAQGIAEDSWNEPYARHSDVFERTHRLLETAGCTWNALTGVAAGRGPGAFSGLRIGLLAAQGFAAPGKLPVIAVSSAEAMARAWLNSRGVPEVLVVGDARRDHLWAGRVSANAPLTPPVEWTLYPRHTLAGLPHDLPVISPHPQTLGNLPFPLESVHPTATSTGKLALEVFRKNLALQPCTPIYLHPAVASPPPS
ncbi:MAG TPA: tRNA (adenosine(37)-N6)-threonylcarbamoyltransferase complex dimerization subunit type 1 TsaB [Kiritimatiellia bacterium]|nr:tRNA (adenosine(37)-N6)-threonylcarbamoyltransferase complex dimerization subunit type 1 TsaB [Kiritimatiellia bacterium]